MEAVIFFFFKSLSSLFSSLWSFFRVVDAQVWTPQIETTVHLEGDRSSGASSFFSFSFFFSKIVTLALLFTSFSFLDLPVLK